MAPHQRMDVFFHTMKFCIGFEQHYDLRFFLFPSPLSLLLLLPIAFVFSSSPSENPPPTPPTLCSFPFPFLSPLHQVILSPFLFVKMLPMSVLMPPLLLFSLPMYAGERPSIGLLKFPDPLDHLQHTYRGYAIAVRTGAV